MPKVGLRETFELETRNKYTKVNCELGLSVEGRELPSMAVLGDAVEQAIKLIEDRVAESYKVVPPRGVDQTQATVTEVPVAPSATAAQQESQPQPTTIPFRG